MYWIATIIGLCSGVLGGLIGIGGAIIMIPAMVLFLHFEQHQAQGTALAALIPPIGILAAYEYYKNGYVNIPVALFIAAGFLVGGYFGAKLATNIETDYLKKIFGLVLLIVSMRMIFWK
jgi:Predicted permeases